MTSTRRFPSSSIARGWYTIGWKHDFQLGQPVALRYFDSDLLAFRGRTGNIYVVDAYCPQTGADIGQGGVVEGDALRCPDHGLRHPAGRRNTGGSKAENSALSSVCVRHWPTHEIDELVLVHYSSDGAAPAEGLPDRFNRLDAESWEIDESCVKTWRNVPMVPQFAAENSADAAHFKYVHRAGEMAELVEFHRDQSHFFERFALTFGAGGGSTWATPHGPLAGSIDGESWGLGLLYAKLNAFDKIVYVLGITPISAYEADLRSTTWVPKNRGNGDVLDFRLRDKWVRQQNEQVEADMKIWVHQSYVEKPPFTSSERPSMRAFRSWARQFYEG